jgi:uncharacterized protein YbaR (Trm112 family)
MDCPGCRQPMAEQTLAGRYGEIVRIDLCHGCAAIWFDRQESLILSPRAALELMACLHAGRAARTPLPGAIPCPRCRNRLVRSEDVQRQTSFFYWRCPGGHGRFITFVDFLREKAFLRPLAPRELDELRQNVRTMTCSSCGAPIDLMRDSACGYCRTPIAMLDAKQIERVVEELRASEASRKQALAELPVRLLADRVHVERTFAALDRAPEWANVTDSFGLVEGALGTVAHLLHG